MIELTFDARVERTAQRLLDSARQAGMVMTGDARVCEADAASLLGYSAAHVKLLRTEGKGPVPYGRGMAGARVSYRLDDLAAWIEAARNDA